MKAWLDVDAVGMGAGLGRMDILVVPRENGNSLIVKATTDGRVWIEDEEYEGQPGPDAPLDEVEISEELVEEVDFSFRVKKGDLTQHAMNLLMEFVKNAKS